MVIYFKNRQAARAVIPAGKLIDNGPNSAKRWAKDISNIANIKLAQRAQDNSLFNAGSTI